MHGRLIPIQVLRGVSALLIVWFHSNLLLGHYPAEYKFNIPFVTTYGFFGVDLFFVISGFIIAHITKDKPFNAGSFVWKRFWRIFPIYWIVCLVGIAVQLSIGIGMGGGEHFTWKYVLGSALLLPLQGVPYYAPGWSLEHEIIFYGIAVLALSLGTLRHLAVILLVLGLAGIVYASISRGRPLQFDYHLVSPFHLAFLLGVLVRLWQEKLKFSGWLIPFAISAALFFAATQVMKSKDDFEVVIGRYVLVSFACAALMIGSINFKAPALLGGWVTKVLLLIGNASFSLYLVHWVIFRVGGLLFFKTTLGLPGWSAEFWRVAVIFLVIMVAIFMHRFIEKPLIMFGERLWFASFGSTPARYPQA